MTVASPMKTAKSGWDLADRHPTLEMRVAQFKGSSLTWHHWTTKQLFDETRNLKLTGALEEVRPFEKPASKTMHVRDPLHAVTRIDQAKVTRDLGPRPSDHRQATARAWDCPARRGAPHGVSGACPRMTGNACVPDAIMLLRASDD